LERSDGKVAVDGCSVVFRAKDLWRGCPTGIICANSRPLAGKSHVHLPNAGSITQIAAPVSPAKLRLLLRSKLRNYGARAVGVLDDFEQGLTRFIRGPARGFR
jgi:hypothetical protein